MVGLLARPSITFREKGHEQLAARSPSTWMTILVFGLTYLLTAGIYAVITVLAVGERARSFKAVSPGLLPPLGHLRAFRCVYGRPGLDRQ
jgi:hypothetical protein